jgi:riboflavin kinase/FMN adenylyltransferase
MKIIHDTTEFTGHRAVVALGMFDGVHIGHQALIRRTVALATELEAQSVVCTFDRHPLSVLCPDGAPEALLPLHENLKKFERLGAEWALVQAFTPEYGATDPVAFLRGLVRDMRAVAIVAGVNYTFGAKGRGDAALIRSMADVLGYRAEIVPPVMDGDVMCSSTRIRSLLARGETEHAQRLLKIS